MSAPSIRVCTRSDIATLAALQGLCFPAGHSRGEAWSREALGAHQESPGHLITLVGPDAAPSAGAEESRDEPPPKPKGGFLVARWVADEAEILLLGVAPAWRRQGLASQLIEDFLARAAGAGVRRCHLEVASDNAAALALYRALGFARIGRRKGYYNHGLGPPSDALLLCKTI